MEETAERYPQRYKQSLMVRRNQSAEVSGVSGSNLIRLDWNWRSASSRLGSFAQNLRAIHLPEPLATGRLDGAVMAQIQRAKMQQTDVMKEFDIEND